MAEQIWHADSSWLTGRTALITGATSGIGLATAQALARLGVRLRLVGRDPAAAQAAEQSIRQIAPHAEVQFFTADLSKQTETRRVAEWALQDRLLDALVNNVGAVHDSCIHTVDGIERQFAVNYVNQVLLTRLLLPRLAESSDGRAPSRIVMVSSRSHRLAKSLTTEFVGFNRYVSLFAYRQSKLAQCLFTVELARRLNGWPVTVNALCPGPTRTSIGTKHTRPVLGRIWWIASRFFRPVEVGASTVVSVTAADELHGVTGQFFERCQQTTFSQLAQDRAMAAKLWTDTCDRLGLPHELERRT